MEGREVYRMWSRFALGLLAAGAVLASSADGTLADQRGKPSQWHDFGGLLTATDRFRGVAAVHLGIERLIASWTRVRRI